MRHRIVDDAEMDEREALGRAALDLVDGLLPAVDVDIGRRRRRHHVAARMDAHAGRVTCVERAVGVEIGDVMRRMPRRREAREADHLGADDVHVLRRHRRELAPEVVERVAVEAPRASLEPLRLDQVRRADLRHVHLERRVLADEHAGRARMVEVDVAQQQMPDVGELQAARGEARLQRIDGRRRAAVEEGRAVRAVEHVAPDRALDTIVKEIDRLEIGHGLDPTKLARGLPRRSPSPRSGCPSRASPSACSARDPCTAGRSARSRRAARR